MAQVASLHLCPGRLSSGTVVDPPAQSRNITIKTKLQLTTLSTCTVSGWLTYLVGSSRFWSFIWAGMICVARGPEAYGWGSCPLNSDWTKCSCQLEIRKRNYQQVIESVTSENNIIHFSYFMKHWRPAQEFCILTCVVEGSCLESGTTLCPRTR